MQRQIGKSFFSWTLDLYIFRRFLFLGAGNLVCLTLIYVFIDAVENLDDFSVRTDTITELLGLSLRYYLVIVPVVFCQLLGPVVALTGGLFTVTLLHRLNELAPMLAGGRPYWRIFLPILIGGLLISIGTFLVQELWIPATAKMLREVRGKKEGSEVLTHLKHLDTERGILIKLNSYHVLERRGEGVTVLTLSILATKRQDEYEYHIQAREIRWVQPELEETGYWLLVDGQIQKYDSGGSLIKPPRKDGDGEGLLYEPFFERRLITGLTPEDLESQQETVHLWLPDLRDKMRESLDRRWPVMYSSRFAGPMSSVVLLLIGLPVITFYGSRNIFFGALVAAILASAYFVLSSSLSNLALRGFLPVSLGPWLVPIVFSSFGVTWLKNLRT